MRRNRKLNSSRLYDEPNPTYIGTNVHKKTVILQERITQPFVYTTICRSEVFGEVRKINNRRRIILHQGTSSCYTFRQQPTI